MSATTTQLTDAVTAIETALAALGTAYGNYGTALSAAKASRAVALGPTRAPELDNAISTAQLSHVLAGRLRALGVVEVLHAPASTTPQSAGWVAAWNANVTAIVP